MQIKEQIMLHNVALKHPEQHAFVSCKCKPTVCYIVWRVLWAIYHTSWFAGDIIVLSLQDDVNVFKWFIYLSNWMYLVLTVECVIEAVVVLSTLSKKSQPNQDGKLPWYLQLMWLLYTVSAVGAVVVCIWYWAFIHKGKAMTPVRFNTHAMAAIYIVLNMVFTRLPLRLLHFIYPLTFGVIYTVFSFIYYSLGGTNQNGDTFIYSILDWSRPGRTLIITSLSNFIFIPLVHVILWTLSVCFQKLHELTRKNHVVYSQGIDILQGEEVDIH